jgi:hypothetical protein
MIESNHKNDYQNEVDEGEPMKRFLLIMAVLIGVAALFGAVSVVNAQDPTPTPGEGYGPGWMGGGMQGRGRMMAEGAYGTGAMHDYMEEVVAARLGVSLEELESLHAEGKTFWQIAEEKGLAVEDARQLMLDARSEALDAMLEDDVISQEQADWMKTRMSGGRMGGFGGGCMGSGYNGDNTSAPRGRMMGGGRW